MDKRDFLREWLNGWTAPKPEDLYNALKMPLSRIGDFKDGEDPFNDEEIGLLWDFYSGRFGIDGATGKWVRTQTAPEVVKTASNNPAPAGRGKREYVAGESGPGCRRVRGPIHENKAGERFEVLETTEEAKARAVWARLMSA